MGGGIKFAISISRYLSKKNDKNNYVAHYLLEPLTLQLANMLENEGKRAMLKEAFRAFTAASFYRKGSWRRRKR